MKKRSILYVVIPCYNEELVLKETTKRLTNKLNKLMSNKLISEKSKVLYVDDGSKDQTWNLITEIHNEYDLFAGIKLSRNKGQQNAILAGLSVACKHADIIITLDADLQDDIETMDKFILEYENGSEIVYGVRGTRNADTFFKKTTALTFYKFLNKIGIETVYNHCEYRLMTKRVVECLLSYKEVNLFLRGIVPLIGFKYSIVTYPRDERFAGNTNYNFKKLLNLASDAITSFSVWPLRLILKTGIFFFVSSIITLITLLILFLNKISYSNNLFITSIIFLATSINMISIGTLGEYIGKIYSEVKARPKYFIAEIII